MGTMNWPGTSEESTLSGPSISGLNFEKTLESYFSTAHILPEQPSATEKIPAVASPNSPLAAADSSPDTGSPEVTSVTIDEDEFFEWAAELARLDEVASNGYQEPYDPARDPELQPTSDPNPGPGYWPGFELAFLEGPLPEERADKLLNVLRFAEPVVMPSPVRVDVYGGSKRVQRLLPTMTAEEQANYIQWTPELGATALATIDPATLSDDDVLSYIQATERMMSWAMARQAAAINEFATRRPPVIGEEAPEKHPDRSRYAAAELMAMFAIGAGAAEHLIADAELLIRHLPDTFEQFSDGSLDNRRVQAVIRGCMNTPPQILHDLEDRFLNRAMNCNPSALTRRVRLLAEHHNPEPIADRHQRARTARDVWIMPLPDGMAVLGARLPATDATLLFNSLDEWARAAKLNGEDSHGTTPTGRPALSAGEYRADILIDLLHQVLLHPSSTSNSANAANAANSAAGATNGVLDGDSGSPYFKNRVPAILNITVSADCLLGKSTDPALLEGYGPIPVDNPQELAATAKFWRRFLTDPDTGRIVSIGRKSRKPPKAMAREVRFRDPVCTGIGCDRPASSCDLDHTLPYHRITYDTDGIPRPPGETSIDNLRPRCPYCHHVKDDPYTGWTVENVGPGVTKTTTPTGRVYLQTQGDIEAPF